LRGHTLSQAKVQDLDPIVSRDHDVAALQIAMDEPALVRMSEAIGDLQRIFDSSSYGQLAGEEHPRQHRAVDVLHNDEGAVASLGNFVHRADVGMAECGCGTGFGQQPRA
jgi:hypothetical protein